MQLNKSVPGLLFALGLFGFGVGTAQFVKLPSVTPVESTAKIIGPASVDHAGQYAAYHVDFPSKDPAKLIFVWSVEPLCPVAADRPLPAIRPTSKPGEAQLDTLAGHWRLSVAIADPGAKTGLIVSMEVHVESSVPGPGPSPGPAPQPGPLPSPGPNPPAPPAPEPATRFSQFTADVKTWLSAVNSPDKATETAQLAAGAAEVVTSLQKGPLSRLSGLTLRIGVVSAVLANHNTIKNAAAWKPFGNKVNAVAAAAENAGQLKSAADWAEFLTAFSAGLK